jgi:predicted DNA repair protein MutK
MPRVMSVLSVVGTAAMLWVGGSIVVHGLEVTHLWAWPYDNIHDLAKSAANAIPAASGFVNWTVTALFDGMIGAILGMALIPLVTKGIMPVWASVQRK